MSMHREPGLTRPLPEFGRADELVVRVRAGRQQAQHVLGAEDGHGVGLHRPVQRRDEHVAVRLHEPPERVDDRGGIGHVLEHFHARDDVVFAGMGRGMRLGRFEHVVHLDAGFERMQLCDLQQVVGEVEPRDQRALARHRFGQQAAAAADVEHLQPGQASRAFDVLQSHRVQVVQRTHFALRIPPATGGRFEAGDFGGIDVAVFVHVFRGCRHHSLLPPCAASNRARHASARSSTDSSSM